MLWPMFVVVVLQGAASTIVSKAGFSHRHRGLRPGLPLIPKPHVAAPYATGGEYEGSGTAVWEPIPANIDPEDSAIVDFNTQLLIEINKAIFKLLESIFYNRAYTLESCHPKSHHPTTRSIHCPIINGHLLSK
eukprot:Gb_21705 [translate_table: standard]